MTLDPGSRQPPTARPILSRLRPDPIIFRSNQLAVHCVCRCVCGDAGAVERTGAEGGMEQGGGEG